MSAAVCPHGMDPDECFECVLARMDGMNLRTGLVVAAVVALLVTLMLVVSFWR